VLGDQVLVNIQSAANSVTSTRRHRAPTTTTARCPPTGLSNSSFAISGNATYAEATANRASNAASVGGGAVAVGQVGGAERAGQQRGRDAPAATARPA
jgi:hypothetical protein